MSRAPDSPACDGCATHRVTLLALVNGVHQGYHKRIDNTWNRPVELPPIEPWWECKRTPCTTVAALTREADQVCLAGCGIVHPPMTDLTFVAPISSAPEGGSDHQQSVTLR